MRITEKNLNDLLSLTKKASSAIMEIYDSHAAVVEYKPDGSPLDYSQSDLRIGDFVARTTKEI